MHLTKFFFQHPPAVSARSRGPSPPPESYRQLLTGKLELPEVGLQPPPEVNGAGDSQLRPRTVPGHPLSGLFSSNAALLREHGVSQPAGPAPSPCWGHGPSGGKVGSTSHPDTHPALGRSWHPNPGTLRSTAGAFLGWGPSNSPGTGWAPGHPSLPRGGHTGDAAAPCSARSPPRARPAPLRRERTAPSPGTAKPAVPGSEWGAMRPGYRRVPSSSTGRWRGATGQTLEGNAGAGKG